jgi:hypothetical protein
VEEIWRKKISAPLAIMDLYLSQLDMSSALDECDVYTWMECPVDCLFMASG